MTDRIVNIEYRRLTMLRDLIYRSSLWDMLSYKQLNIHIQNLIS